ncbi:MAG: NAD-dependent epimerase/dehydratase family protein [Cyclobacteriaceae bacterium]
MDQILITGALGQLGTELIPELHKVYGTSNVLATDLKQENTTLECIYEPLDVLNAKSFSRLVKKYRITQVYHLAAILSANGENDPKQAWQVNMNSLLNALEICRSMGVKKLFWPSSIGVFGPETPNQNTPQFTIMNPNTVYGISKLAGERWCEYYHHKFGLDVRSLRYPGLIGYKSLPGGGTTDYAVDIYHSAIAKAKYTCFLKADTRLPLMYIPEAVAATLELMDANADKLRVRSSYNLAGLSLTPRDIANSINRYINNFSITYKPDYRQHIADSWPNSIDDSYARTDWDWESIYTLDDITEDMLKNLRNDHKPLVK